jgi:CRISPR-associated endonuclease/helicase Cas3
MGVDPISSEASKAPVVDVSFPLQLQRAPRDHGYALYGALCRIAPELHEARWLGVHPLSGHPIDNDTLELGTRGRLRLRLPAERIVTILPLAGATLHISDCRGVIGAPTIHPLTSAPSLDARMVAIKLTAAPHRMNPELGRDALDIAAFRSRYVKEIERQLAALEIKKPFDVRGKRSLTVGGRRVIGYAVRVSDLSHDESLRLLEHGIGGKRRMGCGVFRPTRGT